MGTAEFKKGNGKKCDIKIGRGDEERGENVRSRSKGRKREG